MGFRRSNIDECVFYFGKCIVLIYVDDSIIMGSKHRGEKGERRKSNGPTTTANRFHPKRSPPCWKSGCYMINSGADDESVTQKHLPQLES
jgi:hypothetical protein